MCKGVDLSQRVVVYLWYTSTGTQLAPLLVAVALLWHLTCGENSRGMLRLMLGVLYRHTETQPNITPNSTPTGIVLEGVCHHVYPKA